MKQPPAGPRYKQPTPAIRVGSPDHPDAETRYASLLAGYMRALALLWMGQGVFLWWGILLADDGLPDPFETMSVLGGAAVIFFCVLDPIVAVGLWLAGAWGGAVWLVAVSAQWMAAVTLPGLFPYDRLVALLDLALVAGYFTLTYYAARESETA